MTTHTHITSFPSCYSDKAHVHVSAKAKKTLTHSFEMTV